MTERDKTSRTTLATPMILWDLPTRIFHWSLVVCVAGSYLTGEDGDLDLHQTFGLCVIGLVLFRIMWGFVGSESSRFASFLRGPSAILTYLRAVRSGAHPFTPTHNPLGALSVIALLALLLVQAGLGLFATDDIFFEGPLNGWVSYDMAAILTGWHHLTFDGLAILIILHLVAIGAYAVLLRTDLVSPMVTGRKLAKPEDAVRAPRMAPLWLAVLLAVIAGGIAYGVTLVG
jgi:cytochrome b